MKRTELRRASSAPNFIGSWLIKSSICDDLIKYYEEHQEKHVQGVTVGGLNLEFKDRKDITLKPNELNLPGNEVYRIYFEKLYECYKDYNNQWPFLASIISNLDIGRFNTGKYLPGQHFQQLHCERSTLSNLHRALAFMTYLNDVEDGGSTYFNHYDLDIKPQKGLTLLWPADWTHSHKGNLLKSGVKYIITGWLTYPK